MSDFKSPIKLYVLPRGATGIVVVDNNTNKMLLLTYTFSKKVPSSYMETTNPSDIVNILAGLATKGHPAKLNYDANSIVVAIYSALQTDMSSYREKADTVKDMVSYLIKKRK